MSARCGDKIVDGVYQALDDPTTDRLFALFASLLAEVWTVRDRQRLLENVLEARGVNAGELIQSAHRLPADIEAMKRDRDAFVQRVLGVLIPNET